VNQGLKSVENQRSTHFGVVPYPIVFNPELRTACPVFGRATIVNVSDESEQALRTLPYPSTGGLNNNSHGCKPL
jgi:hypothetical protein